MIIRDNDFIVKGRKFTSSDVERILINYIETENKEKIKFKPLEHAGESLVDFCKRAYEYDQNTCDNFHTLLIRRPYMYRGMKKGLDKDCFADITITQVLKESEKWKDYIIESVHYGSDCSITVRAKLQCKTVNDLIHYCGQDINSDCIFHEVLTNKQHDLYYIKQFGEEFEDTVYVKIVDVDKNKKIKRVYYMKNN